MSPAENFKGKDKVQAFLDSLDQPDEVIDLTDAALEDEPTKSPHAGSLPSQRVSEFRKLAGHQDIVEAELAKGNTSRRASLEAIKAADAAQAAADFKPAQPPELKEPAVTDAITAAETFKPTTPSELVLIDGEWETPTPNTEPPTEAETVSTNAADIEPPQDPYYTPNTPAPIPPDETHRLIAGLRGADPDVHEWLNQPEPEYDWLIPGLLERGDRLILTGSEGGGKSTLLRLIAVTAAAGLHPFNLTDMNPLRVLFVDLENSDRHSRRQFRPLVTQAQLLDHPVGARNLIPLIKPDGLDLLSRPDREWLTDRIAVNEPDLLIIGPSYKLADGDPNAEETAKAVATTLDRIRVTYQLAVILEAHSPHDANVGRPYGASLWKRWPEFGIEIRPNGALRNWRTPRDERDFPTLLQRGGTWPWVKGSFDLTDPTGSNMVKALIDLQPARWSDWRKHCIDVLGISDGTFKSRSKQQVNTGLVAKEGNGNAARYSATDKGKTSVQQQPETDEGQTGSTELFDPQS